MRRYRLLISYDGTLFYGWQSQTIFDCIQSSIERAISVVLKNKICLYGASRTDKGVHALGQVAHFDFPEHIDIFKLTFSLNSILPNTIRIFGIEEAERDFHSRFDAISKTYTYDIQTFHCTNPFSQTTSVKIVNLDVLKMEEASKLLIGKKNFKSLTNRRDQTPIYGYERTIIDIKIDNIYQGIRISIKGNSFLYKMARNIVGILTAVGQKKINTDDVKYILKMEMRTNKIVTAPAKGLMLRKIEYKEEIFKGLNS